MTSPADHAPTIATHDGQMHADDLLAVAMLEWAYPNSHVIRTRDVDRLAKADIVVDVGGVYDPKLMRFDHHQADAPRRQDGTPYSGAGLIWRHFGGAMASAPGFDRKLFEKEVIEVIDRKDNGLPVDPTNPVAQFASDLHCLNPNWNEENAGSRVKSDARFLIGRSMVTGFLSSCLMDGTHPHLAAMAGSAGLDRYRAKREIAIEAARAIILDHVEQQAPAPVLHLPRPLPWEDVLDPKDVPHLGCIVFPRPDQSWIVRSMPTEKDSPENRCPMPEELRGQPQDRLRELTGRSDITFCHRNGFMAVVDSKDAALWLAGQALAVARRGPSREEQAGPDLVP